MYLMMESKDLKIFSVIFSLRRELISKLEELRNCPNSKKTLITPVEVKVTVATEDKIMVAIKEEVRTAMAADNNNPMETVIKAVVIDSNKEANHQVAQEEAIMMTEQYLLEI